MKSIEFTRDADRVYKAFTATDNNELVALREMKVMIPARFPQRDLANFEEETSFVGIAAFIVEEGGKKYYGLSCVPAYMRSEPSLVNTVNVDDVDYIEMTYEPGALIVANLNLVKIDNLMYRIYDELIAKGRVPWYMSYADLGQLFANAPYHAGVKVGANPAIMEMIVAAICRNPDDVKQYYRQSMTNLNDIESRPPTVIPLREVSYGATNAIAKLMGPYFDDNVTSTLVSPGERVERVERLLRM